LGIGDWGLGIGDWGLGPIPNPHLYYIKFYNYYDYSNLIKIKTNLNGSSL
jgi:hypothetical protein